MRRRRRKDKNNTKLYMTVFIITVMVLSTAGFVVNFGFSGNNNQATAAAASYGGAEFTPADGQWEMEFNDKSYLFYFHPASISVYVPTKVMDAIERSNEVNIAFDPAIEEAQYIDVARFELSRHLEEQGKVVRQGVTKSTKAYNLPVINCENQDSLTIMFSGANNESKALISENCVTIQASNPGEHVAYAEQIIYTLLGVA